MAKSYEEKFDDLMSYRIIKPKQKYATLNDFQKVIQKNEREITGKERLSDQFLEAIYGALPLHRKQGIKLEGEELAQEIKELEARLKELRNIQLEDMIKQKKDLDKEIRELKRKNKYM